MRLTLGTLLTCALFAPAVALAAPPAAAPAAADAPAADAPAMPTTSPREVIVGLTARLQTLTAKAGSLPALHTAIAKEVAAHVDYDEMGRRALGETYSKRSDAERATFRELLGQMVEQSYVKRFKPGKKVEVKVADKVRMGKGGRAQVKTQVVVESTRADVAYSMLPQGGAWKIYDIVVDEASQLSGYRKSFRKIVEKEGWDGLIKRMRKSATER